MTRVFNGAALTWYCGQCGHTMKARHYSIDLTADTIEIDCAGGDCCETCSQVIEVQLQSAIVLKAYVNV